MATGTATPRAGSGRHGSPPAGGLGRTLWRIRREWTAYLFIAPGVLIFSIFTLAALVFGFWLTFHQWSIIEPETPFVGLDNYRQMLDDEDFKQSIINTFYFTGASIPLTMSIGLLLALLLNQPIRLRGLFRTMYYLPVVTPFVVTAILWKWLYNSDYGLFNYYLLKTHLIDQPLLWLSDQDLAMPAVIIMSVWGGVGFSMVIYLAGLQAIPDELYEAAEIDGAGMFSRFWNVTLPLLSPTTLFLLVIGIIGSFQVFTQIYIMTQGGPAGRTATMVYFMYEAAFKFYEMGYASTLAFLLFAMLLVATVFQLRYFRAQL
jgi:multiple sugar transport system permease protein